MNARIARVTLLASATLLPLMSGAQPDPNFTGHYPAGVEGIKGGTLPPPGFYFRDYNLFYRSDNLRVKNTPPDFDYEVTAYVNAPRAIWISDYKILGGFYGADVLLPIGYVDQDDDYGIMENKSGVGDVFVEPITLSWHPQQWDFGVGYGFWAPTGNYDDDATAATLIWKGNWAHMLTAGGTYYVDTNKTIAVSILNRYEINYENDDYNITPGNTYTLEWGISKSIRKTVELGVVGYWQQQTTKDENSPNDVLDRIISVGPEVNVFCPQVGLFTSVRYLTEFGAKDRPEGGLLSVTFTKLF